MLSLAPYRRFLWTPAPCRCACRKVTKAPSSTWWPKMHKMAEIEHRGVEPDAPARVVIDENTGVIVIGDDVRISTVAIAQGNLTIKVTETPQVSQPAPFSETGTTTVVPRTNIQVDEGKDKRLGIVNQGVSLQE